MKILVIDGQGGRVGRQIIESILARFPAADLTAVGTNSLATECMIKGGAKQVATGENAVIVGARHADVIVGPLGIVIADSLLGEITPAMAVAVGQSSAVRILIPMNLCDNVIAGIAGLPLSALVQDAVERVTVLLGQSSAPTA